MKYLIFTIIFLFSFNAFAQATPLQNELLKDPISLNSHCSGIIVREWRSTQSSLASNRLVYLCQLVANNFYRFTRARGYKPDNTLPSWNVSLIPLDSNYRSLNDNKFRFSNRPHYCSSTGRKCESNEAPLPVSGWTQWDIRYLFVRNDVIVNNSFNYDFDYFFVHELFHVFSYTTGVRNQEYNPAYTDEVLAKEFALEILN